jgi:predicted lipoprotein with Yx(FWY)xxD motif
MGEDGSSDRRRGTGAPAALLSAAIAVAITTAALAAGGCGSHAPSSGRRLHEPIARDGLPIFHWKGVVPGYLTIHIVILRLPRLGDVLVDGAHRPFYAFQPDRRRAVTCTGGCNSTWRPFTVRSYQALDLNPLLESKLLGADAGPSGARVVTFGGWPLYTYAGDRSPGTANGQGLYSYGGRWYVLSTSGSPITSPR